MMLINPKIFHFDPDYYALCQKYGEKSNIEIKKQIIANAVKVVKENQEIVFKTAELIKKGFKYLICEMILIIIIFLRR